MVGARMGEKGMHVGHAQQRQAQIRGAHSNRGVHVKRARSWGRA